jgi:hypothetical protein
MEAVMAMRGVGMQMAFAGAGLIALALAGGCSSSSGSPAKDAGSETTIHRLDSGEADAEEAGTYTGPQVTSCTMTVLPMLPPPSDDGGADAGAVVDASADGGVDAAAAGDGGGVSAEAGAPPAPGTTGTLCTSNADCKGNECALTDPTPTCFVPVDPATGTNCDPKNDGFLHYCDGPDVNTSPGICLPLTNPPTAGQGVCVQQCRFKTDGSRAFGCMGNTACNPNPIGLFLQTMGGAVEGLGSCGGGCMTDADCRGPYKHCSTDFGYCLPEAVPAIQQPCDCLINQASMSGFCAKSCVTGSTTKCPSGMVCDAFEPTMLTDQTTNTAMPAFVKPNAGLAGYCFPSCDNGACPASTSCVTSNAAGPDCQPQ